MHTCLDMEGKFKRSASKTHVYIAWKAWNQGSILQLLHTAHVYSYSMEHYIHVLMGDVEGRRSKQGQTNNKAKQHSTPKAVTFPKKNELPRVHVRIYESNSISL